MEKLTLYIEQNEFIIHTEKTDLSNLRVCLGDQSKFFKNLQQPLGQLAPNNCFYFVLKKIEHDYLFIILTINKKSTEPSLMLNLANR
ncbi:hypothetical protein GCM10025853_11080 [Tetragenococcus halophilus subsp. halophilus DSM 20339]|nr:hypothetical protein GCM10025853_11080 [Tetragenococcus halophilus subsp. halophilus DSM 20339]